MNNADDISGRTAQQHTPSRPTGSAGGRGLRRGAVAMTCAALVAGSVAGLAGPSAAAPSHAPSHAPSTGAQLRLLSTKVMASGSPGYLARVDDGRHVTSTAAGLGDLATGRRLRAGDQFEIGSNTKVFTSTLALQLVGRGELSLDDSVEQHLPGVVPGGDKITVRQLLQHTSGLFNYTADPAWQKAADAHPEQMYSPGQLVAIAMKHKPDFAPGTSWNYSNTNYILLGLIIEKVSGHTLPDLVQHRIAAPLGLTHTYLVKTSAPYTGPGYAHGYAVRFKSARPTFQDMSKNAIGGWGGAAGAVVSTSDELARFFTGLMQGKLLPAAQLAEMKHTVPLPKAFPISGGYGLGLLKIDSPCGTVWGHGGDTFGHHSTAVVSEDGRRTAITDTNAEPSDVDGPVPGALKFAKVAFAAEHASICAMLDKPIPAAVSKDLG